MTKILLISFLLALGMREVFPIGALYARRAGTSDTTKTLWLRKYDASATLTDQIAVTHVDMTFKNEDYFRKEGIFIFPLPEGAVVTELALWINGQRVLGEVMASDTARAKYDSIVRRQTDPALLEYLGKNVFKLNVFPIEANGNAMSERRIEITYAELLPYEGGRISYLFLMKAVNLSPKPLERASVTLTLTSQKKVLAFGSPTHGVALAVSKISDFKYAATYGEENTLSEKDLRVEYRVDNDVFDLNALTYEPATASPRMFFDSTADPSYFLLWVAPPENVSAGQVLKKDVVFVADVSGSMAGTRIEQLRTALHAMVDLLNIGDRFNILAFSTKVTPLSPDLVVADSGQRALAHGFISRLGEGGLTNMEEALKLAFASSFSDTAVGAAVFFTDGVPTWPAGSAAARILDTVKAYNPRKVALHTFGVGVEVQEDFLRRLAQENNGFFNPISQNDSIAAVMEGFLKKISSPLIRNISVTFGGLDIYDVFPRQLPNLYLGSQLAVLGRYRNTGFFNIAFHGALGKDSITLSETLGFPQGPNHPFVPRLWASAKIDYLLNEIAAYGEQAELVNNVKLLGKKYGIVTPYTSYLVIEPSTKIVEDKTLGAPQGLSLENSPNPFNPSTLLRFSIPRAGGPLRVVLKIYDARGRFVRTLADEVTAGGHFTVQWDGRDEAGRTVGAGIYLAVLEAGKGRRMIRMQLVK